MVFFYLFSFFFLPEYRNLQPLKAILYEVCEVVCVGEKSQNNTWGQAFSTEVKGTAELGDLSFLSLFSPYRQSFDLLLVKKKSSLVQL